MSLHFRNCRDLFPHPPTPWRVSNKTGKLTQTATGHLISVEARFLPRISLVLQEKEIQPPDLLCRTIGLHEIPIFMYSLQAFATRSLSALRINLASHTMTCLPTGLHKIFTRISGLCVLTN